MAGRGFVATDLDIFEQLLYASALRGDHSTGVARIKSSTTRIEEIKIKKDALTPDYFLYLEKEKPSERIIDSVVPTIYMGHTRYATMGKVNAENAHPFETERFVGAHNGTLEDYEFWDYEKTDSQMMFEAMDKSDVYSVLNDVSHQSAFAVSIYEKLSNKLYIARNHRRPLTIAVARDRDVIYWASEDYMLRWILTRNKTEYDVYNLDPYTLFEIEINDIKKGSKPWTFRSMTDKSKWKDKTKGRVSLRVPRGTVSLPGLPKGSDDRSGSSGKKAETSAEFFQTLGGDWVDKTTGELVEEFDSSLWDDIRCEEVPEVVISDDNIYPSGKERHECITCGQILSKGEIKRSKRLLEDDHSYCCSGCLPVVQQMQYQMN